MMKTFVLLMLLGACSFHCNLASTCNEEELSHTYLDRAINMITRAKSILKCSNYTKYQLNTPMDCTDVLNMGYTKSGVYTVWPINRIFDGKSVNVYCDMDTDGGGWTVIQRRGDFGTPKDYFYRNWENYKEGFGNIKEDFWLGNDKIYALTNQRLYSARFDLKDVEQNKRYAIYDKFWIDEEERQYTLHVSLYTGDAGDSMAFHNNLRFSTFDNGNVNNCAVWDKGGWWYIYSKNGNTCCNANLNGLNYKGKFKSAHKDGILWNAWKGLDESLEWTEIKIRPKNFKAAFL